MELASKCECVKKYQWQQHDLNPSQQHQKPTLYHSAMLVSWNLGKKILYLYIMRSRGQNNPCSKLKSSYTIILRILISLYVLISHCQKNIYGFIEPPRLWTAQLETFYIHLISFPTRAISSKSIRLLSLWKLLSEIFLKIFRHSQML